MFILNDVELTFAPERVRNLKNSIPEECLTYVELDKRSRELAKTYINEEILGKASLNDAYHIAIASVPR